MKKHLLTKTFLFLAFLIWANVGWGQVLLNENFNYGASAGNLTTLTTNWTAFSGTTQVGYSNTSLSMSTYASTDIGGSATFNTANSEDITRSFTAQSSGSLYASFLLNTVNTSTSGTYFLTLRDNSGAFFGRFQSKQGSVAGKLLFGIAAGSTITFGTTEYDANTTYLVVIKFDFVAGTTNDVASIYILTAPTNSLPGTPEATSTGATDPAQLSQIAIRQASGCGTGIIDGLRITQSWGEAAGIDATAPVRTFDPANGATGVIPTNDITISFDDYIRNTDNSVIDNANVEALLTLKETNASGAVVAFNGTIDATNQIITINPDADLAGNQVYYVEIGDVEDVNNNLTAGTNITFTTIDPTAPVISDVAITEVDPYYAGDDITVTWTSTNVTNVKIEAWVPSESTWVEMVASTDATDGSEVISIPSDAMYSTAYKVRVSDVTPTANAESANFTIIATPTINDIQSNTSDGDLSVYNGQIVRTSGIITFSGNGEYVIQDGDGSWNGIYVYDFNFDMTSVEGDSVTIQATVATFNGVTQLATVTSLAVNNSGNLLPTISTITTNQLTEEYEGVLVKIVNAQVTNATVASGVFEINDGSGALNVDDNLFGDAEVGITNGLDLTITGIGHYNNAFQLLPRYAADMVSATDTVGSTVYTVDQGALTITGMPFSTDLATFEGNITPAAGATWDVFDANGTDIATVLDDTKLLIVVAADGITSSTYTITRNAALTDATVSSTEYTVDNVAETITGVPNGTDLPTFKSNIIAPTYGSFEVYETGGSVVATDLQTGYILRGTAEDGSTTKDYTITVIAIVMDADSYVDAPTTQVAAATLAVVDGDETAEAFDVFSFDITDAGTTDGEPTMVTQVVLFYGPNMTLDFENEIDSGYLVIDGNPIDLSGEPVFGVDSIVFPIADGEIVVPDGSSVNAVVKLILNTTVADGKVIQFFIDANQHGFEAKGSGSGFAADFGTDVVGNDITIDVVATELNFSTEPTDVYIDNNITPAVVVEAIDANGNVDIDYVTDITITATGATLVGTPVTVTPTAGIATFDALSFSDEGTGVTLIAASGTLTNAVSIAFDVTVEPVKELFFSEYIEGDGGNNKALEIYNATGTDVDLHDYVIRINGNGSAWTSFMDFPVGTTIANGDVYVIAHSASNAEILAVTDSIVLDPYGGGTSFVVVFNGNDARALCKVEGSDTTIIDIIGEESVDSLWSVAGTESATQNHTLLRKQGTTIGNANWTSSAGTNTTDSEWIVMDANYFDDLGSFGPKTGTDILEYSFALQTEPATIDDVNHTVDIEVALGTSLTNLVATFTLSDGATAKIGAVVQESGITANDFSSEVIYTVTAEDASAQDWAVNVTVATTQSSAKDITSFTVEGIVGDATIGDGTVSATVEFGTDITSLKPVFDISDLASIADTSAARDFTNPQTYVVTAEDGTTKDWVVTITEESGIEVANIAALRALYTSSNENIYNITGEVTFTHTTSPYFYIQDGTAAILIYNGNSAITSSYSIGDNVSDLVGTFATFGGNMQFELIEDPGTAISSGNTIAPQVVTIPDFTTNYTDYDAELIKLEDVTFSETGNFAAGSNYTLNNGNDNVALRTNFSGADYIGTAIPAQTLDVTAIAGVYNGTPQVYPRALADMVVVTGINDPASFVSVHVYPNPSNGQFNIELNAQKAGNFDLEIINVLGQVIYQKQITQDGTHKDMIDISDKAKGLYYIRITDGTSTKVQKLMIK